MNNECGCNHRVSSLRVVALDMILDEAGKWHFIEINENPIGLAAGDELYSASDRSDLGIQNTIDSIVRLLSSRSGLVGLLLPYQFRLTHAKGVKALDMPKFASDIPRTLTGLIEDFNAIGVHLTELGTQYSIFDVTNLVGDKPQITTTDGQVLSALLKRAPLPHIDIDPSNVLLVNDLRARLACRNKLLTKELLRNNKIDGLVVPPAYRYEPTEDTVGFLQQCSEESYVVIKPNWGAAGIGVKRLSVKTALAELSSLSLTGNCKSKQLLRRISPPDLMQTALFGNNLIVEPWIASSEWLIPGRSSFYCDFRVVVVEGTAVNIHVRRAPAPSRFAKTSHSDLPWLTSLGSIYPVQLVDRGEVISERYPIAQEDLKRGLAISEAIVNVLDQSCTSICEGEVKSILIQPKQLYGNNPPLIYLNA
ncbi:MAG: hypothetical protein ABL869_01210 [Candidatus Nitrotoga sp.]